LDEEVLDCRIFVSSFKCSKKSKQKKTKKTKKNKKKPMKGAFNPKPATDLARSLTEIF